LRAYRRGHIGTNTHEEALSTKDVHPWDRFDYWPSVACNNLVGHSSTPECRQTFAAEIETGMLADIELVLFENSPDGRGPYSEARRSVSGR
jgi:hypothetical protein